MAFINNIVDLFIEWVLCHKLGNKEKRTPEKDKAKLALARPFLTNFFKVLHNKSGLKPYLIINGDEFTVNWSTFPFEAFYNAIMEELFAIQMTRLDYNTNKKMFVVHHIFPKNEGGGEETSNTVLLHTCEHGLVHLIRWLYTGSARDLGAFTSNIRTEESIIFQRERRAANPPRLVIPPRPQADRPKPRVTARVLQHMRVLGKKNQINSRLRVNPFTWFIATQSILMEHVTKITHTHVPAGDILDLANTASAIARQLAALTSDESLAKTPQVLSQVLGNEKKTRHGWSIIHVTIGDKAYSLSTLQVIFTEAMSIFPGEASSIGSAGDEHASLADRTRIAHSDYYYVLNVMLQFLQQRQQFIDKYK